MLNRKNVGEAVRGKPDLVSAGRGCRKAGKFVHYVIIAHCSAAGAGRVPEIRPSPAIGGGPGSATIRHPVLARGRNGVDPDRMNMNRRHLQMKKLNDKVAVITGAAGGIGKAAAKLFVAEGAQVMLVDRDEAALAQALAEIGPAHACTQVADVADLESTRAYVQAAVERFGGIDVLLANAGIEGKVASIVDADPADFDRLMAVNVRGVWLGLKFAIPEMRKRGGGSIVITSSIAGVHGAAGLSPYVTSKHAVIGMMRSAALECAPFNIRVNTVNPAPVETRMMRSLEEGLAPGKAEAAHAMLASQIPLGRYGEPEDIARLMLFLASDDAAFLTGAVYMADGGRSAR